MNAIIILVVLTNICGTPDLSSLLVFQPFLHEKVKSCFPVKSHQLNNKLVRVAQSYSTLKISRELMAGQQREKLNCSPKTCQS